MMAMVCGSSLESHFLPWIWTCWYATAALSTSISWISLLLLLLVSEINSRRYDIFALITHLYYSVFESSKKKKTSCCTTITWKCGFYENNIVRHTQTQHDKDEIFSTLPTYSTYFLYLCGVVVAAAAAAILYCQLLWLFYSSSLHATEKSKFNLILSINHVFCTRNVSSCFTWTLGLLGDIHLFTKICYFSVCIIDL